MKKALKYILPVIWLVIIITPPVIFFSNRSADALTKPATAFPLFGLIAFTLIWSQIMVGSFMRPLEKLYPRIFTWHIIQGLSALLFALIHPALLFISLPALSKVHYLMLRDDFVAPTLVIFVYFAQIALVLLILGILAGLLRNWSPIKRFWHWIHLAHYLVFFLIFFHSWNLGTDLSISPVLRGLWLFYLVTVIAGLIYRRIYIPSKFGLKETTS